MQSPTERPRDHDEAIEERLAHLEDLEEARREWAAQVDARVNVLESHAGIVSGEPNVVRVLVDPAPGDDADPKEIDRWRHACTEAAVKIDAVRTALDAADSHPADVVADARAALGLPARPEVFRLARARLQSGQEFEVDGATFRIDRTEAGDLVFHVLDDPRMQERTRAVQAPPVQLRPRDTRRLELLEDTIETLRRELEPIDLGERGWVELSLMIRAAASVLAKVPKPGT